MLEENGISILSGKTGARKSEVGLKRAIQNEENVNWTGKKSFILMGPSIYLNLEFQLPLQPNFQVKKSKNLVLERPIL